MTLLRRRSRPLILAHRGFHRRARQNTKEAVVAAWDVEADGVEFDVRVTLDGHYVLHHDRTRRISGRRRAIASVKRDLLPEWVPQLKAIIRRTRRWSDFLLDV